MKTQVEESEWQWKIPEMGKLNITKARHDFVALCLLLLGEGVYGGRIIVHIN